MWSKKDPRHIAVQQLSREPFIATEDVVHAFSLHFFEMRGRFAPWLENEDPLTAAQALFITAHRAEQLLQKQVERVLAEIIAGGGFRENLVKRRVEQRDSAEDAAHGDVRPPDYPVCGKPMRRKTAKTGSRAGKDFWSCGGFPDCKSTRNIE